MIGLGNLPGKTSTVTAWSDDLKAQTRSVIEGRGMFAQRDGQLYLKHADSAFGTIAEGDLARGVLRVVEKQAGAGTTFANADALVADG